MIPLRKEPTTDSKIVDLISEDEKVEIIEANVGDDKNWYKVKYKGNTGYVYGRYIKVNDDTSNTNTNTTKPNNNTTNNTTTKPNTNNNNTNNTTQNTDNNNVGAPFAGIPGENGTTVPDNNNTVGVRGTEPRKPRKQ